MSIARAISIRQPFVEQIPRGTKTIECRSRLTNIRERVYLYAGLRPADDPEEWESLGKRPGDLPTGMIVGTVEIADCHFNKRTGLFEYALRFPKRLRAHLEPRNQPQPGFWRPVFRSWQCNEFRGTGQSTALPNRTSGVRRTSST